MTSDLLRTLILATMASSVATLLALALRKPMRLRCGARAAYALWALVPMSALVVLLPAPVASMSMQLVPTATTAVATSTPTLSLPVAIPFDPSPWLAGLWLLGSGIVCLLFVRQQRRFVRALGQLSNAGDETLRAQTAAGCPALLGVWRPRVILPSDFEPRGDAQINALAAALRCVFWFNPLIHFAASRFRFDQELACDAVVISRFPEARRSYADAMLKTQLADFGLPVGCHWQSSHPLKERIAMLKQPLPGRARAALGIGLVAGLIVADSYAAWAAQPVAEKIQQKTSARIVILKYKFQEDATPVSSELALGGPLGKLLGEINADNDEWKATLKTSPRDDGRVVLTGSVTLQSGQVVPWMEKEVVPGEPFVMSNFVAMIGHTLTLRGTLAVHNPTDGCPDPKLFAGSALTAFEADIDRLKGTDKLMSVGIGSNGGQLLVVDGIRSVKNDRAVSEDGKGFRISLGTKADPRTIDVVPQPQTDGLIRVDFTVRHGDDVESEPALLVNENQEAEIKIAAENGQPPLDLAFTVARVSPEEMVPENCRNPVAGSATPSSR